MSARRTVLAALALTATAPALSSCRSTTGVAAPLCQRDDQCGAGACVSGACVSRVTPPASWSVELAPKSDSTAAFTELVGAAGTASAFDLTAVSKITVAGTLAVDATAAPLESAHLVLRVPALIDGRPDLQYETDLLPPAADDAPATFTLTVPASCVGRTGTLQILPTPPDDATHAPATFTITVAATLPITLPSKTLTIRGRLLSALGDPLGGLVARAFSAGALVSNVVTTTGTSDADRGAFTLMVPSAGDGTAPAALTVEVEPTTSDATQPHFWTKPLTLAANTDLGDIHMPAYGAPASSRFGFQGDGGATSVANVVVRARTVLIDDPTATVDFMRSGSTDATGQVSLDLLPGSQLAKRLYDIAAVPPAGSLYAATCLEAFPIVAGGLQPVTLLDRRPVLSGVVVGADGLPVAGVVVLATRTAAARATACDGLVGTPQVAATTMTDGTFHVPLDAGIYTLDFDPPAGEPYPRLTRGGVIVPGVGSDSGDAWRVQLPEGALVEGTVRDGAGKALPLAGVRFYAPACVAPATCPGAAPTLQAQTRADANGHFRAVIPSDAAATGAM